jgi:hypothetical protein
MKLLIISRLTFAMMALAVFGISFSSCGEDEPEIINGCTDPKGDNYNADATDEDGSCEYFGLYTGSWTGTFNCPGALMSFFTSADLQITEAVSETNDLVQVLVLSSLLTTPVPTNGTITNNSLAIEQSLMGVSLDLLEQVPGPETWNIGVNGTLDLSSDGNNLEGSVTFTLEAPALMLNLSDNCTYSATKQ